MASRTGRYPLPVPRPDPAPPVEEGVSLIDVRSWVESPLLLNLFLWAVVGLLALSGLQPTDGGWPAVLPFFLAISLVWILVWVFAVPNRIVVAPGWLARRRAWRWQVIRAAQVTGVSVRRRGRGPIVVLIRDGERRAIAISPRMARRREQRDAVGAFLREASPRAGEHAPPSPPEVAPRRRVWRRIWRLVVLVAILLNAVVGILRVAAALH